MHTQIEKGWTCCRWFGQAWRDKPVPKFKVLSHLVGTDPPKMPSQNQRPDSSFAQVAWKIIISYYLILSGFSIFFPQTSQLIFEVLVWGFRWFGILFRLQKYFPGFFHGFHVRGIPGILRHQPKPTINHYQWSFLVPLIGGRYHIIPQLAVYTTYILPIWGITGYLPPIKGTRNNH